MYNTTHTLCSTRKIKYIHIYLERPHINYLSHFCFSVVCALLHITSNIHKLYYYICKLMERCETLIEYYQWHDVRTLGAHTAAVAWKCFLFFFFIFGTANGQWPTQFNVHMNIYIIYISAQEKRHYTLQTAQTVKCRCMRVSYNHK